MVLCKLTLRYLRTIDVGVGVLIKSALQAVAEVYDDFAVYSKHLSNGQLNTLSPSIVTKAQVYKQADKPREARLSITTFKKFATLSEVTWAYAGAYFIKAPERRPLQ